MHGALHQAVAEAAEATTHLPIPPVAFGLIAFGSLIALLLVTYAFRNASNRR